jgi:flagellar assembly protein FliH
MEPEPFEYPQTNTGSQANGNVSVDRENESQSRPGDVQREKEVFDQGLAQGQARERAAAAAQITLLRQSIETALEHFKKQRETYFSRVESEVVRLALAIARKILHREAQMDPLLLAGMVHVALEKFDSGTKVRLRASPGEILIWQEHFLQAAGAHLSPELIGDPTLAPGECALETEVGSTQVSLGSQLKEIEQGFFDLLQHRPQVR